MRSYLTIFILLITSAAFGQWAHGIGSTLTDKGTAIAVDADGNVYVAGYFRGGPVDFDPSPAAFEMTADNGYGDIFFAKYSPGGALLWANQIGGTDEEVVNAIAVDASGNVYLAGYFTGTGIDFDPGPGTYTLSSSGWDVFFAKYTTDGAYVWANSIGGTGSEKATCIQLDGSGNIYIAGSFTSTNMDFDSGAGTTLLSSSGGYDPFFMKYTNAGVFAWAKKFGGTGNDEVNSMAVDASANIYLTGFYNGTANFNPSGTTNLTSLGGTDIYFAKYSSTGALTWAKNIGGAGQDRGNSIAVDASGNVYLTGAVGGTGSIDLDPDAGTQSIWGAGIEDCFLAKYNSSGAYVWKVQIGKGLADGGRAVALDAGGNVYVTGYFSTNTVDFDPSGATYTLELYGSSDMFIAMYTSAGAFGWASAIGGGGLDEVFALATDGTWLYLTGYYTSSPFDSDPGAGTNNLSNNGGYDIVIGKYKTADGLLPVELSSFSAKAAASQVILQWETKTEVNNYGFEIERMTGETSKENWTKIGFIKGHGNSNSPVSYEFTDNHPMNGKNVYRLKQIDNDGRYKYYDAVSAEVTLSGKVSLAQNVPNPFNPATSIKFQIPFSTRVTIKIYDLLGREIASLLNEEKAPGSYIVYWNGRDSYGQNASSGVYFYKLTAGSFSETRKMNLLR